MKNVLISLAAVMLILGCDGSSSPKTPGAADQNQKLLLQLNWKPEPQFGGFYAARISRHFSDNRLDVEIMPGGAGVPTVDMLAAGKVPFGIVSGDELIVARARGKKLVALFAVYQTHPQGIMTRASRGFKEIGDIFKTEGTLAMEKGLPYFDFLKNKYGFEKLKIVPSPFGDLSVYRSDEKYAMQCFVTSEPLAAKKAGVEPVTFLIADAGYNPYATVLATTDDYLAAHGQEVMGMITAVQLGWQDYLRDPAPANAEMGRLNPTMDAQTFADSAEAQKSLIETDETRSRGLGCMNKDRWQTLANQLVELKVIDRAPPVEELFPQRWRD